MALQAKFYQGHIFEYREEGELLGVMTGVTDLSHTDLPILLQHIVLWPGAPQGALIRMLVEGERVTWESFSDLRRIILDIEHTHPFAAKLRRLASHRGFRQFQITDTSTWFVKERSP